MVIMKHVWLNKAESLKQDMDLEFQVTGSINSKTMNKYKLLIEASERC